MNVDEIIAVAIAALVVTFLGLLVGGLFYATAKALDCRIAAMEARYQASDIAVICK